MNTEKEILEHNDTIIEQLTKAVKDNFPLTDLYLKGLLYSATSFASIKVQEKTINIILEWLKNNVLDNTLTSDDLEELQNYLEYD